MMLPHFSVIAARRVLWRGWLLTALGLWVVGCSTPGYLIQAVRGHHGVMTARTPCQDLIEDPKTSTELKTRLLLAGRICAFAECELGLKAGRHYRHYADLGRPCVVWNVYAAREFSVEPKTWRYPLVGTFEYRGYFSEDDARRYAARLTGKGWETHLEGATAYSTLGWFHDPLLNTFLWADEAALAETIFHELAHQRLFVSGDTDFNEAFATVVGREGARRWLRVRGDTREFEDWEATLDLEDRHVALALRARKELEQLYASRVGLQGKWTGAEELRERKRAILEKMCRDQAALRGLAVEEAWSSGGRPCDWNNARLNSVATYYELVPAFEALFAAKDHDFAAFYQAVEALADLDSHQRLEALTAVTSDRLAAE